MRQNTVKYQRHLLPPVVRRIWPRKLKVNSRDKPVVAQNKVTQLEVPVQHAPLPQLVISSFQSAPYTGVRETFVVVFDVKALFYRLEGRVAN